MDDLRAAILERVGQLEALAWAARRDRTPPWTADTDPEDPHVTARMQLVPDPITVTDAATASIALHVATWEPDNVIALCLGVRSLVDSHKPERVRYNRLVDKPDGTIRSETVTTYQCSCADRSDVLYPCDDLKTIARMLGIDPDDD